MLTAMVGCVDMHGEVMLTCSDKLFSLQRLVMFTYVEVEEHAVVSVLGQPLQLLHLLLSQQLDVHLCKHKIVTKIMLDIHLCSRRTFTKNTLDVRLCQREIFTTFNASCISALTGNSLLCLMYILVKKKKKITDYITSPSASTAFI